MSRIAYLVIHSIAPNRFLIWAGAEDPPGGAFTWALSPVDEKHTRLVMRIRFHHHWTDQRILLDLFTEFADHVAVPKMLLGIRDRVEGRRIQPLAVEVAEITLWIAAFLEFVVAVILILCSTAMVASLDYGPCWQHPRFYSYCTRESRSGPEHCYRCRFWQR